MKELLTAALEPVNIIPTVLLIFVLIYWLSVMVGLLDMSFLDLDLDTDADIDAHAEIDSHVHLDAGKDIDTDHDVSLAWLNSVLVFFNLGHIPFMVWLSFLVLPMWFMSILFNNMLGNTSSLLGWLMLLPVILVSLFLAKILTMPFVKLFKALNKNAEEGEIAVGKLCILQIPAADGKLGQASVQIDGAPLLLNVRAQPGTTLEKGKTALVISYNEKEKYYFIEPFEI